MSRLLIYLYCSALIFIGVQTYDDEFVEDFEDNSLEPSDEILDERDRLTDAITDEYLKLLDYEINESINIFENVLEDKKIKKTHSDILQGKKLVLKNFIVYVTERQQTKIPPKSHRAARFFHVFSKSVLYKDFLRIIERLEPTRSRYDAWIEDALNANGLKEFFLTLREKRSELISKTTRKIDKYVNRLTAAERRRAAGQKLDDWSEKMKKDISLEEKMEIFKEFLRYEYLEKKVEN